MLTRLAACLASVWTAKREREDTGVTGVERRPHALQSHLYHATRTLEGEATSPAGKTRAHDHQRGRKHWWKELRSSYNESTSPPLPQTQK